MSSSDKKFFAGFIVVCVICIVAVKLVFLGNTSKTSAVEKIIESYSNLEDISVFAYSNKVKIKCALLIIMTFQVRKALALPY